MEDDVNTIYILRGSKPLSGILGVYDTFEEAKSNLDQYFDRTLDEDGAGKHLYHFDEYIIQSMEVGRPSHLNNKQWYVEFEADYGIGELIERE